jgi:hypothetical protein
MAASPSPSPAALPSVPPFVQACNITNDIDQSSYDAEVSFAYENSNCLKAFTSCLNNLGSQDCSTACTADIDLLQNGCGEDDTYCEIAGENLNPTILPPFTFRTAACVPQGCNSGTHDAYQAYWQGLLCGPKYYNTPDCQSIQLNCAYPLPPKALGVIIGATVGACLACCCLLFLWWRFCAKKPLPSEEEVDLFEQNRTGFVLVDEATGMPVGVVGTAGQYTPLGNGSLQPSVGYGYPTASPVPLMQPPATNNTAPFQPQQAPAHNPRYTYAVKTGADGISLAPSGNVASSGGPPVAPTAGTVVVPTTTAGSSTRGDRVGYLRDGSHAAILSEGEDKL